MPLDLHRCKVEKGDAFFSNIRPGLALCSDLYLFM